MCRYLTVGRAEESTSDVGLGSAWSLEDGDDGGGDGVSATSGDGVGVEIALRQRGGGGYGRVGRGRQGMAHPSWHPVPPCIGILTLSGMFSFGKHISIRFMVRMIHTTNPLMICRVRLRVALRKHGFEIFSMNT